MLSLLKRAAMNMPLLRMSNYERSNMYTSFRSRLLMMDMCLDRC